MLSSHGHLQIFLSDLEERQRESRLYVDSIGDIVARHIDGLDIYRGYCVNQSNAARTLADLKASKPDLRSILDVRLSIFHTSR